MFSTELGLGWGVGAPAPTKNVDFLQSWGSVVPGKSPPTKAEDVFYRAGAGLGSWSTSSNKRCRFSTELGLCSPREITSDKSGRCFLQSWGWAGELEH